VFLNFIIIYSETEIGMLVLITKGNWILCDLASPDYGYITNFGKAHLEGFGGIEGVIQGKSEMYINLKLQDKLVL
jgi:UDP-N-acetylmuramoyl-tripeptide--D-alanyl-D-alanine ligase